MLKAEDYATGMTTLCRILGVLLLNSDDFVNQLNKSAGLNFALLGLGVTVAKGRS